MSQDFWSTFHLKRPSVSAWPDWIRALLAVVEGDVVHLVAYRLTDLSPELASVGNRDAAFPLPHGRGDEFHHGGPGIDPRSLRKGPKPRDIHDPYGHIDEIRVKIRDFR
jgi:error-prone DNA polymerase